MPQARSTARRDQACTWSRQPNPIHGRAEAGERLVEDAGPRGPASSVVHGRATEPVQNVDDRLAGDRYPAVAEPAQARLPTPSLQSARIVKARQAALHSPLSSRDECSYPPVVNDGM